MGNHAFYLSIPPKSFPLVVEQLKRAGPRRAARRASGAASSSRSRSAPTSQSARELNDVVPRGLPARLGVPHRPLPRQGDGPEHPGAALRQPAVRADLERQLRRPRADHDGRGHRRRRPRRLLRRHRRGTRRHPEPPAAAAGAHRDGGADLVRRRATCAPRRRRSSRPCAARRPRDRHRARPVRRRLAGRREGRSASSRRTA